MEIGRSQLSDTASLKILKDRAAVLAKQDQESIMASTDTDSLISFELSSKEQYAISYDEIITIIPYQRFVQVPNTPDIISGVIHHDGGVLSIINLEKLLGLAESKNHQWNYFLLIGDEKNKIAIPIIRLLDQIFYDKTVELGVPFYHDESRAEYIKGLYEGKVALLDASNILDSHLIKIDQRKQMSGATYE
jgi:purine-binding chemotaxis protein CheW